MKKDFFSRGVRMIHPFGKTEEINDPLQHNTWDLPLPANRIGGNSPGCEVQQYGESNYLEDRSPIQKPSGEMASTQGPNPGLAEVLARPIPVGTKRRYGPLKTDK
jgi:hypothetical protein